MPEGALIAVDWGTSNVRALLLDANGAVLDRRESDDGIGKLAAGAHQAAFGRLVAGWPGVPAVMAGMIGSRQGWREAAYVPCPTTPDLLAANVLRFDAGGHPAAVVPGVMLRSPDRDADVIRGEETQLAGLIAGGATDGLVILPGTHSKWAILDAGAITTFQTFLTGELFELLSRQSFLRHSVAADGRDLAADPDFELAVRRIAADGLPFLSSVFSVRARQLVNGVAPGANLAYLSGLVIGGEIAAARETGALTALGPIRVVGSKSLARAYRSAFAAIDRETVEVDGADMVRIGLVGIARSIGFLPGG